MSSRIYSTCLALLTLLCPLVAAKAQSAEVSAREFLRPDLRQESLIEEAFRAAKRVPAGAEFEIGAQHFVAEALLDRGREDDARLLIDRAALATQRGLDNPYLISSVAPLYGRVHTQDEMHAFMTSLPERGERVPAAIAFVKDCVTRGDTERLRGAVGHLTAASYVGWSPRAEAWLAIGWRVLGQEDSARGYENKVLEGPYSREDDSESGWAIRALVDQALERDDVDEACRLLDTYAASPKVEGRDLYAVGANRIKIVRALAMQAEFERARERAKQITDGRDRAAAFAEIGAALWNQKGVVAAEEDLKTAGAIAKNTGSVLTYCRVAETLDRGGFNEAATALAWDAMGILVEQEKGSRERQMNAGFLAQTFLALGHEEAATTFGSEMSEEAEIEAVITWAGLHASNGNLEGLLEIFDGLSGLEDQARAAKLSMRAARTAFWKLKDREQGDRFAAELTREMVERARALPADRRALLLGWILVNGLVEPVEPSSYHPWSVPPTLAGNWKTPEDAQGAAALLAGVLGEFPMPHVRGIRKRALRFHPDAELFEFDGFRGSLRYHYLLLRVGEEAKLVDGTKASVDPFAAVATWRESDEALFDLVHLSIGTRSSQSGRFRAVESLDVLEELRAPGAALPQLELKGTRLLERSENGATLELDLLVSRQLERITVTVHENGQISIAPKELIAKDLPLELEAYIGGCFERRLEILNEVWPLHETDEVAWAFRMGRLFALGFGEGGWRVDASLAFYFLGIAKEKGHPNPMQLIGRAWRDGDGVSADPAEAIEWFVAAASHGNLDACCEAAELLLASPSPERRDRARTVLNFGKERGHAPSAERLSELDAASSDE